VSRSSVDHHNQMHVPNRGEPMRGPTPRRLCYTRDAMTDVQVSNARRIGFTALALMAFWVLAWRAYSIGVTASDNSSVWSAIGSELVWLFRFPIVGLLFALAPTIFLSLSIKNSLLHLRTRFLFLSALLMAACSGFTCWLGEHDIASHVLELVIGGDMSNDDLRALALASDTLPVSWFWLLIPIILTTAFVIFAAWRRAVRNRGKARVRTSDDGRRYSFFAGFLSSDTVLSVFHVRSPRPRKTNVTPRSVYSHTSRIGRPLKKNRNPASSSSFPSLV
jgi:hypothetical protein